MIYIGIVVWNWLDTLIKKKSLIIPILSLLYLAWLGGAANPVTTTDYDNYEANYNMMFSLTYNSRFEWAYLSLAKAASLSGLSYAQFRLILVSVIFIVLFLAIRRFTNNLSFFVATFSIFPFFNEVTQVRSFAMYTLVLLAAGFLVKINKKNVLISVALIFLSTGFHSSGYFYFIFLVIRLLIYKKIKLGKILIFLSLFASLILMITSSTSIGVSLAQLVGRLTGNSAATENILLNFVGTSARRLYILKVITIYGMAYGLSQKMAKYLLTGQFSLKKTSIASKAEVLMSLIYMGMLGLPLLVMSDQYQRFPRFGLEAVVIIAALYFEFKIKISERIYGMIITLILTTLASIVFYDLPSSTFAQSIPYIAHWLKSN